MSSANGSGMRWNPGGSFHPPSSIFSAFISTIQVIGNVGQTYVNVIITDVSQDAVGKAPHALPVRRGRTIDTKTRTCGSSAQNIGDELRRTSASTSAIFFFLIIVLKRALNVRLLPEYICQNWRSCTLGSKSDNRREEIGKTISSG